MIDTAYILLSMTPTVCATIGTALGQGYIGKQALHSLHKQPAAANTISKLCIIGMAITETAAIMGIVISVLLLNDTTYLHHSYYTSLATAGIAIAMSTSSFCAGIASSYPAIATCESIARQPFMQTKLLNIMLITQTLIMTPNMFATLVSLLIKSKLHTVTTLQESLQLLASGISIGLGSIGPSIGLSLFAFWACTAIGINKTSFNKVMTFTFICEAIIETPAIFSLLISLMILNTDITTHCALQGWQFIGAALCIGLSTIAPGINAGRTGAAACKQIAFHLEHYSSLSKITLLALAMIDSFAIYGLLISIVMLLF